MTSSPNIIVKASDTLQDATSGPRTADLTPPATQVAPSPEKPVQGR